MIKTGTVASVTPTQRGGYQPAQGDYVYTFDMVVNTPEGQVGGEIGSKSQIYPIGAGQPITVDVTSGQYGPRLKKVNPQYQQPQGQSQPTQLNPQTQAVIDQQFKQPTGPQAAEQIQDHFADPSSGRFPTAETVIPDSAPILQPSPEDYAAKDREKVLGMCFTNLLSGRLAAVCPTEMENDLGTIAAIWRLAAMCIDGTGRVEEGTRF